MLLYSTAAGMGAPGLGDEATEVTDAETLEASPEATELLMVFNAATAGTVLVAQ
jgi:hypothetical protein